MDQATFRVRIYYSEQVKGRRKVFEQEVTVSAASEEAAKGAAEAQFHSLADASGAAWHRSIVSMEILPPPGPKTP